MSLEVKNTNRVVMIRYKSDNPELFTKVYKEIKEKARIINEYEKIIFDFNGKNKIYMYSHDISSLAKVYSNVFENLQKKVEYSITIAVNQEISINNDKIDAFDLLKKITKPKIDNILGTASMSHKLIAIYNEIDYMVDMDVKTQSALNICIQKKYETMDKIDLCVQYEELLQMYYNTIHITINK